MLNTACNLLLGVSLLKRGGLDRRVTGELGGGGGTTASYTAWGDGKKDFLDTTQSRHTSKTTLFDFLSFIYIFWINMNYNLIILFTVALQFKDHPLYSFTTLRISISPLNCNFVVIILFSYKIRMIY